METKHYLKIRQVIACCMLLALSCAFTACEKEPLSTSENSQVNANPVVQQSIKGAVTPSALYNPHYWVALMVQNITPATNYYDTKANLLTWTGQNGASGYACSTDCSGLLTGLFKQSYGYSNTYMKNWTGRSDPYASNYYNEIVTQDRFLRVHHVHQIVQGDIIALKYPTGSSSTGHIMIADGPATVRVSTAPLVSGTVQYEIPVYDCSSSGHGGSDTRYLSSSAWDDGVGRGVFRIYADASGAILGYTWSTYTNSVYYNQSQRQLAVGRHTP